MFIKQTRLVYKFLRVCNSYGRHLSNSKNEDTKKKLRNGPNLKDFIMKSEENTNQHTRTEEILANEIFFKNVESLANYTTDQTYEIEQNFARRKVFFEVHGCQMNVNDTEVAYSILYNTGKYIKTSFEKDADVVLIMTCSIRENSEQKIWNRLKDFCHQKRIKPSMQIGILGCMAERLKDKIVNRERKVDVVCGPDSYRLLPSLLEQSASSGNAAMNVQLSLDETYAEVNPLRINPNAKTAFISIQRGCDNMCSFCIVPFTRGRERSRSIFSILDEIRKLRDSGIREITLLGQNVNSYLDKSQISFSLTTTKPNQSSKIELSKGFKTNYKVKSTDGGRTFVDLLDSVSQIDPEVRIRFTSPHPKDFPDHLLQLIRERTNICKTMHLPAQSGNTACLERMRRGYSREAYIELVQKIKQTIPEISLTSDFIAGFCDETDEEHNDTISLMQLVKYSFCFMYTYSMREKTKAFHRFVDNVPFEVKNKRYLEMVDTFRKLATELNHSKLEQVHLVLVDQISKRSENDLSGRNDNNTLVNFERVGVPFVNDLNDLESSKNQIFVPKIGDYVACKLVKATSQSFRAIPLFGCELSTFNRIKNSIDINQKFNQHEISQTQNF